MERKRREGKRGTREEKWKRSVAGAQQTSKEEKGRENERCSLCALDIKPVCMLKMVGINC